MKEDPIESDEEKEDNTDENTFDGKIFNRETFN